MNSAPEARPSAVPVPYAVVAAWVVAFVAMAGSLWFSEVRFFVPCTLCWYQRILMYPLVLILGVAAFRGDRRVGIYALPLSLLGIVVSSYHLLEQWIPGFGAAGLCRSGVPCSGRYIEWLGFITIPALAWTAFVLISVALVVALRARR